MALLLREDILACKGLPVAIDTETTGQIEKGIYAIYCPVSKTVYIGRTKQFFIKRWIRHIQYLGYGRHYNSQLQEAFNCYDSLQFSILEIADLDGKLTTREDRWMKFYRELGFNVCNVFRSEQSEETKKKISENHKRKGIRPSKEAAEKATEKNKTAMLGNTNWRRKPK